MKTITVALCLVLSLACLAGTADAQTYKITNTLTSGTVGTPVVGALVTANGIIPTLGTTYAITAGTLPAGVALSGAGVFTGTPTTAQTANFTVTASVPGMTIPPQTAGTATLAIKITIKAAAPPMTIDTTTLPDGRVGEAYSAAVVVSGGSSTYGFVADPLNLPTGVTLNLTDGTFSGTPTAAGTFNFTVYVTDTSFPPNTANRAFSITISAGPALTADGTTAWTLNQAGFDLAVIATGGDGSYTFDSPTGIPDGLTLTTLDDRLTLTGTPTAQGEFAFTVTVRDGTDADETLETTIHINPPVALEDDALPAATIGAEYGGVVTAEHGAPPYNFRIVSADAAWLGIDGVTGTLTGTPDTTDTVTVTIEVADAAGGSDQHEFTLEVNRAPSLAGPPLPIGVTGVAYSASIPTTDGTAPFTFSIESGELMRGLTFDESGITGTPAEAGHSELTLRVTDRWGATSTADFVLIVGRRVAATGALPAVALEEDGLQAYVVDLLADTTFDVALKVKTGTGWFYASIARIDGTPIDTIVYEKVGKKSLKIRKFPVETSGRYVLILENLGSAAAEWSGKLKAKPGKKWKLSPVFGPLSEDVEIPFSALKGAKITLTAKVTGKDVPVAELVEIVGPTGIPLDLRAFLVVKGTGFKVAKLIIPKSDDYRIRIRPDGSGSADGVLKVQLKVKSPKVYDYSAD